MTSLFMDNSGYAGYCGYDVEDENSCSDDDSLQSTIKLQLKKPKAWNWELTTSKSSPNIAFPRILLCDDNGDVLADARDADCVFRSSHPESVQLSETRSGSTSNAKHRSSSSSSIKSKKKRRSSTTNLSEINESLEDLVDHLKTQGIPYKLNSGRNSPFRSRTGSNERKPKRPGSFCSQEIIPEDFIDGQDPHTNEDNEAPALVNSCGKLEKLADTVPEIPIWIYSEKGLLKRDLNAKEFDHLREKDKIQETVTDDVTLFPNTRIETNGYSPAKNDEKSLTPLKEVRFDLQKSKSATDVLDRGKRKTKRSSNSVPSKFSGSILERMSAFKRHSSSTDSQDVEVTTVQHGPRYFLRTSNAGTLVVCEENLKNRKIRRRPRSISKISENDENELNCSKEKIVQTFEYPGCPGVLKIGPPPSCNGNGNVNDDAQLYDQVIKKLDSLISKVSLKRNEPERSNSSISQKMRPSGNQFLTVTNDHDAIQRDQSVSSDYKVKRRRKLKELRRCVSAGTVCLSSDEEQDIGASESRYSRNRNRRKTQSKTPKGDQILTLNSNYSNIQPIGASPAAGIIDDTSDEILLRFVRRLESFKQQKNIQSDETSGKIDENRNYQFREDGDNSLAVFGDIYGSKDLDRVEEKENSPRPKVNDDSLSPEDAISAKCPPNYLAKAIRSKGGFLDDDTYHLDEILRRNVVSDEKISSDCNKENILADSNNMGSNVSRNTNKGLSGRRTQSSGNLYTNKNGDAYCPTPNGNPGDKRSTKRSNESSQGVKYNTMDRRDAPDYPLESCPPNLIMPPMSGVSREDRNKFCGSLPNHLDNDSDNVEKDTIPIYNHEEGYIKTDRVEYVTVTPNKPQLQLQQQHQHQHQHQHQQQQQQKQVQHSPYNNSISEKETASTSSESSTFKINQDRPDIQLKLRLTRSNFDPSCDQGYGSERSPEDELPPLLSHLTPSPFFQQQTLIPDMTFQNGNPYAYNFITKDCTFTVQITKGPRGLGLSISGGIDSNAAFPGLIRIKRLFPHQAAWSTGKLQPGDIILEANDVPLTGLTNYEALEVLRTMPSDVILLICRPCDEQYKKLSPPTEPPKPPQRTQQQGTQTMPEEAFPLDPVPPILTNFQSGEFEIIMVKQQGSLGFTLRKEDESVLGHYVRALVREPATTDGRIKPGDKIVAVNDVPLSPMTHEQAVIFLRQAADTVKLRLYRDEAQTPVAAMSPTTSESRSIVCGSGKKAYLRPEAINLLSDLAYKKQNTPGDSTESSLLSSNTSPRRLKRGNKHSSATTTSQSDQDVTDSKATSSAQYIVSSQTTSVCSDSEQSGASQCSFIVQTVDNSDLENAPDVERPNRPNFLNLSGQGATAAPVPCRKAKLQFSVPTNAYDLNNLDNDALDAPRYTQEEELERPLESQLPENHEFTSLPCETFLIACKTESDLKNEATFSYKNPMYQSDHVMVTQLEEVQQSATKRAGNKSLLKWKGVVFSPDEEPEGTTPDSGGDAAGATAVPPAAGAGAGAVPTTDSSCSATAGTSSTPATERHFDLKEFPPHPEGYKIITVELNRGWNSRLGFSLQPDPNSGKTVIRAVYSDSVAARDGRLRAGDLLLMVNEESVENMPTQQVIELLRLLRGSIGITVLRKDPNSSSSSSAN